MKFVQKARKFITLLAALAILISVPGFCALEVSAEGPVTYAVKYIPSCKDWRVQVGTSTFDDKAGHWESYYLSQNLKDGDVVVVYNDSSSVPALKLGSKRLSNLTVTKSSSFTVIYSGDIDSCYLLDGASCSINSNVTNAYVYDNVLCNFNKDVKELNLYPLDNITSSVGCIGNLAHLYAESRSTGKAIYSLYDFQPGTLSFKDGKLATDKSKYSLSPSIVTTTVTQENFDYIRYATDYPDVRAALGLNATALYNHYITYGVKEGRVAYAVAKVNTVTSASEFNYVRYADKNADLKAVFGYDANALYNHYITFGISENRGNYSIYETFDYIRYANDYRDLKAAFGYDAKKLYQHYVTCGIAEKRGNYFN